MDSATPDRTLFQGTMTAISIDVIPNWLSDNS